MIRPGIRRLFRLRLRRSDLVAQELDDEIQAHLALRAEQLEQQGLSPEAARAEALRRFGPVDEARRKLLRAAERRERRLGMRTWTAGIRQDLRYAWRSIVREPGFAAVVVVVIALGVGANATMFGIVDRLLLRGPEHVREPDRVARIHVTTHEPGEGSSTSGTFGYVTYTALRDGARSFERVAAYAMTERTLGSGEDAEEIPVGEATWDFFPLLGVRPAVGRFFSEAEDRPGDAQRVAVLGYGLWTRRYAADPAIVGRTITIDGLPYTVAGVAPKGFTGAELRRADLWRPMSLRHPAPDWQTTWNSLWLHIVARLKPGVTAEQASADATIAFRRAYTGDDAPMREARVSADPLYVDDDGGPSMEVAVSRWLVGVSFVVLLVACANVANLMIARAVRRRREVAVRLALGIARGRLVRLLLTESVLLAGLGGAAALLVVLFGGRLVRTTLLPDIEWISSPVNGRVLMVAAALTLLTGILTGLAPALQSDRRRLLTALHTGVREGGGRSSRTRAALAITQAAFSVVLLVGAGLFVRSLWNAYAIDLGVEPDQVVTVRASWPPQQADEALPEPFEETLQQRRDAFYQRALDRARSNPDVEHAALAIGVPFHSGFGVRLRVTGWDSIPALPGGGPYIQAVSAGYFATVGLQLLRGRVFDRSDHAGTEPVAIVNRTMARTLWPGGEAVGQCLRIGSGTDVPCARVVGIVEDAHRFSLREQPAMQYYIPFGQEQGIGGTMLLVRARSQPAAAVMESLRRELHDIDPTVLRLDVEPLQDRLDPQFRPWRLGAILIGVFGALALVIAAIGLYSLIAYMVAGRTHELGVRLALGAPTSDVLRLVLRRGLALAGGGVAVGVLLSLLIAPQIRELLFDTSPRDPLIYGAVAAVLLVAAGLASLVPARRAARVDPAVVLRSD